LSGAASAHPDHVSFERASFVEPLNTCLKAIENAAFSRMRRCSSWDKARSACYSQSSEQTRCARRLRDRRTGFTARHVETHGRGPAWNGTATDVAAEMRLLNAGRGAMW
jgi:hypothetical protein